MKTSLLIPATVEPVTLEEAKLAARIDSDDFDPLLSGLITAARELAEHQTGRCFAEQTVRVELADWPERWVVLPVDEPTAVTVSYWNGNAWAQPVAPGSFGFGSVLDGTVVAPALGGAWPSLGTVAIGPRVRIDITAGPAPALVPAAAKLYIKAMVSHWKDNPAAAGGKLEANPFLASMLDTLKVYS